MIDPVIEKLVNDLQLLPGVGSRGARRMAMQLFHNSQSGLQLAQNMLDAIQKIKECTHCRNYSSLKTCSICLDKERQQNRLCVVSSAQDLTAIEQSGGFTGQYFVLHGLLSPLESIGPEELGINKFSQTLDNIEEVILALPYTIEGEATASMLINIIQNYNISVTRLAQGLPAGGEVSGMDNLTLNSALAQRKTY